MSTAYVKQIADSPAFFISPGRSTPVGSGLRSAGALAKVGWPSWLCMSTEIVSATILATRGSIVASCPHAFASMEGLNQAAPPATVRPSSRARRDCQLPCFVAIVLVLPHLDELGKFDVSCTQFAARSPSTAPDYLSVPLDSACATQLLM